MTQGKKHADSGGPEEQAGPAEQPPGWSRFRAGLTALLLPPFTWFVWRLSVAGRFRTGWFELGALVVFLMIHAWVLALAIRRRRPGLRLHRAVPALTVLLWFVPLWHPTWEACYLVDGVASAVLDYRSGEAWGGYDYFDSDQSLLVDPETRFPIYNQYRCSRAGYSPAFDNRWYRPTLLRLVRRFGRNPDGYQGPLPSRNVTLRLHRDGAELRTWPELGEACPEEEYRGLVFQDHLLILESACSRLSWGKRSGLVKTLELYSLPEGELLGAYHYPAEDPGSG